MINKQIQKSYLKFSELKPAQKYIPIRRGDEKGIIYSLYSDSKNLIELNFVEDEKVLKNKIFLNKLTLLGKRKGHKKELNLLKETLKGLGLKTIDENYFQFSMTLMRHLSTLGWPIGNSLYKRRIIQKELFLCI